MRRYLIEDAKCGVTNGGMACGPVSGNAVATVKYTDGGEPKWLSLVEVDGAPIFYITDKDVYNLMVAEDPDNPEFMELQTKYVAGPQNDFYFGSDYSDVFDHIAITPEDPKNPLVKLLLTLIKCRSEETEGAIKTAIGKYADELAFEFEDIDSWYDCDYDSDSYMADFIQSLPEDNEHLFPLWLALETDVNTCSVYHDIDSDSFEEAKEELKILEVIYGGRVKDYEAWKRDYLEKEYEKQKDKEFLTFSYVFLGIGSYKTTVPVEEKDSFVSWINGNGSAHITAEHSATEEEVKQYIALRTAELMAD